MTTLDAWAEALKAASDDSLRLTIDDCLDRALSQGATTAYMMDQLCKVEMVVHEIERRGLNPREFQYGSSRKGSQ